MVTLASGGLSGGEVAGLIVAVFWAVLVCFIGYVLVKLGKVVGEAGKLVIGVTDQTVPLLGEVTTSVVHINTELERVDAITANVQSASQNVSALTSVFAATLGSPVIKVAAFSYGVRQAAAKRRRADVDKRVRNEMRAERRLEREPEQERDDCRHRRRHHQAVRVVRIVVVDSVDQPRGVPLPLDASVRLPVEDPAMEDVLEEGPAENAQREHAQERPARQAWVARSVRQEPGRVGPPDEHHVPGAHAGEIFLHPIDAEHPRASPARTIQVGAWNEVEHGGKWLSG